MRQLSESTIETVQPNSNGPSETGFTLLELLIAIAVMGVLMGLGVPAMREFIVNQRTTGAANQLLADLAYARTQALVLQRPVRVSQAGAGWNDGWTVFSDTNTNGAVDGAGIIVDEQYRQQDALPDGFNLTVADGGGTALTDVWFSRLGAGTLELPGNVSVTYPLRFLLERPDSDVDRAATICLAASGAAIIRKGTVLC